MSEHTVRFRLVVQRPPAGVQYCLQRGKSELVDAVISNGTDLTFKWAMRAEPSQTGDSVCFLGPFAQGPPAARFVYLCIGTYAGQMNSPWARRVKVPLSEIPWRLAEAAALASNGFLEAAFEGTAKDGGPAAASVRLTQKWKLNQI